MCSLWELMHWTGLDFHLRLHQSTDYLQSSVAAYWTTERLPHGSLMCHQPASGQLLSTKNMTFYASYQGTGISWTRVLHVQTIRLLWVWQHPCQLLAAAAWGQPCPVARSVQSFSAGPGRSCWEPAHASNQSF